MIRMDRFWWLGILADLLVIGLIASSILSDRLLYYGWLIALVLSFARLWPWPFNACNAWKRHRARLAVIRDTPGAAEAIPLTCFAPDSEDLTDLSLSPLTLLWCTVNPIGASINLGRHIGPAFGVIASEVGLTYVPPRGPRRTVRWYEARPLEFAQEPGFGARGYRYFLYGIRRTVQWPEEPTSCRTFIVPEGVGWEEMPPIGAARAHPDTHWPRPAHLLPRSSSRWPSSTAASRRARRDSSATCAGCVKYACFNRIPRRNYSRQPATLTPRVRDSYNARSLRIS